MGNKLLKCAVIYFALVPSLVFAGAHQDCIDAAQKVLDDALAASTKAYNDTEKAAKEAGYEIKVGKFPLMASGKAHAAGAKDGFIKVIFDLY